MTVVAEPEPTFVDTNILIYANVDMAPLHHKARAALAACAATGGELWISRQVLREYLAALSRPQAFARPVVASALVADITRFQSEFLIAEDGPAVTGELLDVLASIPCGGKQVHDANIVATMRAHGLRRLLTHNAADFRRFEATIQVVPLVPTLPDDMLSP